MSTLHEAVAASERNKEQGNWFPACGGTEEVFTTRTGRRLLYCWPAEHRQARVPGR